jgi:hypothetical protein
MGDKMKKIFLSLLMTLTAFTSFNNVFAMEKQAQQVNGGVSPLDAIETRFSSVVTMGLLKIYNKEAQKQNAEIGFDATLLEKVFGVPSATVQIKDCSLLNACFKNLDEIKKSNFSEKEIKQKMLSGIGRALQLFFQNLYFRYITHYKIQYCLFAGSDPVSKFLTFLANKDAELKDSVIKLFDLLKIKFDEFKIKIEKEKKKKESDNSDQDGKTKTIIKEVIKEVTKFKELPFWKRVAFNGACFTAGWYTLLNLIGGLYSPEDKEIAIESLLDFEQQKVFAAVALTLGVISVVIKEGGEVVVKIGKAVSSKICGGQNVVQGKDNK